jgi:hypothetical protein
MFPACFGGYPLVAGRQSRVTEIRLLFSEPKVYLQGSNPVKLVLFIIYIEISKSYSIFLAV